jgi:hypothetical protein
MKELAFPACLVVLEFTFVTTVIWPHHLAATMPQTTFPLTCVDRASRIIMSPLLQRCVWVILTGECLVGLLSFEILGSNVRTHFLDSVLSPLEESSD